MTFISGREGAKLPAYVHTVRANDMALALAHDEVQHRLRNRSSATRIPRTVSHAVRDAQRQEDVEARERVWDGRVRQTCDWHRIEGSAS